ncbi:MAG: thiamine pyrophosphate-binding protein [Prochlorococcaceae cyanobacterium]
MDIADALIEALLQRQVRCVYGVPGDYVLGLFDRLERSPITTICTAGEEGAGFAADAHARLHGLGVAVVTYGVGALKLLNPVAGAYVERSPLLVISGAPGVRESDEHALLHHRIRATDTQERFFHEVCAETACLDSCRTAAGKIIKVLEAMQRESRPGYLELPRDCLDRVLPWPLPPLTAPPAAPLISELHRLSGQNVLDWLRQRQRPVVLAGVELHRFGLQAAFQAVIEREGWPFATSLSGKSLLSERHPQYLGIYEGAMSRSEVRDVVEGSDGLLILGMPLSDIDTGIFTMQLEAEHCVRVEMATGLRWANGDQESLDPTMLLQVLREAPGPAVSASQRAVTVPSPPPPQPFQPRPATPITVRRLINAIDAMLSADSVVLADVGDALFSAVDLHLVEANDFLTSGYWGSLGFALPAAVGAWGAQPQHRPFVLLGDGSLLMSAIELATLARYRIPAIVVVFDNKGYGTERPMLDGPFNDVAPIDHVALAAAMGLVAARRVELEEEFWAALQDFMAVNSGPVLISAVIDPADASDALRNLTAAMAQRVHR